MGYKVLSTAIIYELLDNEIILANLDSGVYYSVRGSGIPIWQLLVSGFSLDAIQNTFSNKYPNSSFDSSVRFIQQLIEENLLIQVEEINGLTPPDNLFWPPQFIEPTLEKYEEMKDLLMLDPIHEVDAQGWPSKSI